MGAREQLDELVSRLPQDVVESTAGCLALLDNLDELAQGEERAPFEALFSVWSQASHTAHRDQYTNLLIAARSAQFLSEIQRLVLVQPQRLEKDLPKLLTSTTYRLPVDSKWIRHIDLPAMQLKMIRVPRTLDLSVFTRIIQSWHPPTLPEETLRQLRELGHKPLPVTGDSDAPEIEEPTPPRRLPASLGMGEGPEDLAERSEELLRGGFGG